MKPLIFQENHEHHSLFLMKIKKSIIIKIYIYTRIYIYIYISQDE